MVPPEFLNFFMASTGAGAALVHLLNRHDIML